VLECPVRGDVPARRTHDDRELRFGIELARQPGAPPDVVVRSDDAVGGLDEELGLLAADVRVRLLGQVILVVAAAAKQAGGMDRGRQAQAGNIEPVRAPGIGPLQGFACQILAPAACADQ
jgi:hypothetical protein